MANSIKKAGRKPVYEREEAAAAKVERMAACGVPQDDIALYLEMSKETLRKLYLPELRKGKIEADLEVAGKLYEKCVKGDDTAAQIFWCKTRLGWSEKQKVEVSGGMDIRWMD